MSLLGVVALWALCCCGLCGKRRLLTMAYTIVASAASSSRPLVDAFLHVTVNCCYCSPFGSLEAGSFVKTSLTAARGAIGIP